MMTRIVLLVVCLGWAGPGRAIDFARDVRPIFSRHCFACHGPDAEARQAGLRLDRAEGLATVVDVARPADSELLRRIESDDSATVMPPPEFSHPVDPARVAMLRRWIHSGAPVEDHWAYVAPVRSPVAARGSAVDAIDEMIDASILAADLTTRPPASRRTLLRRVCFDLTGLPPTRKQITDFLADDSPGAYERLVDSLLGSPQFGVHVGRHWLDLVRYGDTHGLHLDNFREMWAYRDWVIDAFNANLPFDDFITDQLAGDLKPNATAADLIASGYNRLNVTTNEGGSIVEEVFARNVMDRTDAFGTVFLGLTTQCAACHDHKFDPITQRDYYSLSAFFNSLDGPAMDENAADHPPSMRVPDTDQARKLAEVEDTINRLAADLAGPIPVVDAAQVVWEKEQRDAPQSIATAVRPGEIHLIGPFEFESSGAAYGRQPVDKTGPPRLDRPLHYGDRQYRWRRRDDLIETRCHPLPTVDDRVTSTTLHRVIESDVATEVKLVLAGDDGHVVWCGGVEVGKFKRASRPMPMRFSYRLKLKPGANHLYIRSINHGGPSELNYAFGGGVTPVPDRIGSILRIDSVDRSNDQQRWLTDYYRMAICDLEQWTPRVDLYRGAIAVRSDLESKIPTTLIWRETERPRPAHVLVRGQYDQPGERVPRDVPGFLPRLPVDGVPDRLTLARWLVDPSHPLTARVAVNRFWQMIFGVGLVKTSEDFGSQGEPPRHRELLDHLAVDFIESGWDVKRLLKGLVSTRAYRRDAAAEDRARRIDPDNRLLARGPRGRLDAEMIRDQALMLGGQLNEALGGPSVKPPQPDGLWAAVAYTNSNTAQFVADRGDAIYRRGVYTFWKRTSAPPMMVAFDAPTRESCTARRTRTNTPLQALTLLNETQQIEAASGLADRTLAQPGLSDAGRIAWLFETATTRLPSASEWDELIGLLTDLRAYYQTHPNLAAEGLADGKATTDRAAWRVLANTVLNLDEVLNR